ncbi:MAG TPA: secretin N-terminal domain-containing protein [Myxococcota bacterium]|nr:secretin N-terminal domain-containing protein [Myxococcota bacterium]
MRFPVVWALAAAVGSLPHAGSAVPGGARPPERPATIVALDASELAGGGGVRLRVRAQGRLPDPRVLALEAPARLVLDFDGAGSRLPAFVEMGFAELGGVRVGEHAGFARLVLDAGADPLAFAAHRIEPESDGFSIFLTASLPPSEATPSAADARPGAPDALPEVSAAPPAQPIPAPPVPPPPLRALPAPESAGPMEPSAAPARVYGLELEALAGRDRLLVFATGAFDPELVELDATHLLLRIPGALLDPSTPARLAPKVGRAVERVTVEGDPAAREVRVAIERIPGAAAHLSRQGSIVAVELESAAAAETGVTLQFRDAELAEVVRAVARETGQAFIFDERLQGRITIAIADRLDRAEALDVLDAALLIKGFAALPTPGGPRRILPVESIGEGAPWIPLELAAEREAAVATHVRLEWADVDEVLQTLRPLLSGAGVALAHRATRSLVLAGSEKSLRRWIAIAQALDESAPEEVIVRRLRHRAAPEVAATLESLLEAEPAGLAAVEVWPDERTNALIVRSPSERLGELREWLERLDQPPPEGGIVRVIRLEHADPEELAEHLRELSSATQEDPDAAPTRALRGRALSLAVHRPTHSLVLVAEPDTLRIVDELVAALDRPAPLVAVEALVLEVTTSGSLSLGFDAFLPLTDPKAPDDLVASVLSNPSGGGLLQPNPDQPVDFAARFTRAPLVVPIVDAAGNATTILVPRESFVITADDREIHTRLLMRPHLVATNGEEQEVFVGNNVPILTATTSSAAGDAAAGANAGALVDPLQVRTDIERQDVGLRLRVRPTVGEAGGVRLALELDVSDVAPSAAGDVEEVGVTISQRKLSATVHLADGEFAVVGMGPRQARRRVERGTPFLSSIPLLGWLFRTERTETTRTELLLATQAWVQRSPDERVAESLARRLAFERSLSRTAGLEGAGDAGWAVLVASAGSEREAEEIASGVALGGVPPPRVTRWDFEGAPRFDVFVPGFETLAQAGAAANELSRAGYRTRVVALPEEGM